MPNSKNGCVGPSPAKGSHVKNVSGKNPTAVRGSEKGVKK